MTEKSPLFLKHSPIEIDIVNPFRADVAGSRLALANSLTWLISEVPTPYVLAINSPWGTGKTTFMNMWAELLCGEMETPQKIVAVKLNAWESDFAEDPLVAFLDAIYEKASALTTKSHLKQQLRKFKDAGKALAKAVIPAAVKIGTMGGLDVDKEYEKIVADTLGSGVKDAMERFTKEKSVIAKFRAALSDLAFAVRESSGGRLVCFIDELDRCRPDYAVTALERMKHIFGVEGIVFVLFVDKVQLGSSLQHIYGAGLNDTEYLKRFIDNECALPATDYDSVVSSLFVRYGIATSSRRSGELDTLEGAFAVAAKVLELSLRSIEQCVAQLGIAMLSMPNKQRVYPHLLGFLLALKSGKPRLYNEYLNGAIDGIEVMEHFTAHPHGRALKSGRAGGLTELYLVSAMANNSIREEIFARYRESMYDKTDEYHGIIVQCLSDQRNEFDLPTHDWLRRTLEYVGAFS